jgi:hypothetical protein
MGVFVKTTPQIPKKFMPKKRSSTRSQVVRDLSKYGVGIKIARENPVYGESVSIGPYIPEFYEKP